jgi:Polyketide cyclase / dehydrase and lipid transport
VRAQTSASKGGAKQARHSGGGATAVADLEGSSWIDIDAPIERCFDVIADVERAPNWQGVMQKARALEYDPQGRPLLVETYLHAIVANVSLWLRFDYFEPTGMRWTRERGDLKSLSGAWQLEDLGGGRTRATYSLEIGLNRALALLRKGVRGPAEARVRELLTNRPVEGLKREAER